MARIWKLKVVTGFASAHTLRDYPGDCRRMHGHNWKVEVEVIAQRLDELGMGIDFKQIKEVARREAGRLDHRYLNEIEPFDRLNPTAENIAADLFARIARELDGDHVRVSAVTLWETDTACVTYSEDNSA